MGGQATQQDQKSFTDMPVGEILRRTRLHYNQSLEDIESALRIRASQIEAIECGDLKKLPGKVYAIGFVRSYAEFLGLDGEKMVDLFKVQAADQEPEAELYFPMPASEGLLPPWWVILICVSGAIAILVFWFGEDRQQRDIVENIPEAPAAPELEEPALASPFEAPESVSEPVAEPGEEAAGEEAQEAAREEQAINKKPEKSIILNIRENSWVEIRDQNGKAVLSRVLKAGDQYYVPDRPDLTISIGNAGGVEIEVDGQPLQKLGEAGEVLRRLPLDAKYLKDNFALETGQ